MGHFDVIRPEKFRLISTSASHNGSPGSLRSRSLMSKVSNHKRIDSVIKIRAHCFLLDELNVVIGAYLREHCLYSPYLTKSYENEYLIVHFIWSKAVIISLYHLPEVHFDEAFCLIFS